MFRTRMRIGIFALVLLVGWIIYRVALAIWPVLLCVVLIWVVVRVVVRRRKNRQR